MVQRYFLGGLLISCTGSRAEEALSKWTWCCLWVRYSWNHNQSLPVMPILHSLKRSSLWGTESNAFLKSRNTASIHTALLSRSLNTWANETRSCDRHDLPFKEAKLLLWQLSSYKVNDSIIYSFFQHFRSCTKKRDWSIITDVRSVAPFQNRTHFVDFPFMRDVGSV